MAATVSPVMINSQDHVTLNHKIRKPLLKSLLGPEFLKQQPDSKLKKPDILEMTVCYLTRPYSRCAQEMVNFLPKVEVKTRSQRNLLNHIKQLHTSSDKTLSEADFSPLSYTVQTRPPAPSGGRGRNLQTGCGLCSFWSTLYEHLCYNV
uniref:BHLH domain-containing protein n=1 Tax=Pundamilia nyererei TaxID=303518 RepID=A0A3B4F2X1_9CICH